MISVILLFNILEIDLCLLVSKNQVIDFKSQVFLWRILTNNQELWRCQRIY